MSGISPATTPVIPNYESDGTGFAVNIGHAISAGARIDFAFAPYAQATPNMTVALAAGQFFDGTNLTEVAAQSSGTITAPAANPRIDRVVIDKVTGAASVVAGTEASSPVAPAIPSGKLPVARVALTVGMTSITGAAITDERVGGGAGIEVDTDSTFAANSSTKVPSQSAVKAGCVTKTSSTGAATMPAGTTAQRPAAPAAGMFRLNTTTGEPEWYDSVNTAWVPFATHAKYTIEYLLISGGGGGGYGDGGGGGAGGYLAGSISVSPGTAFSVVIGAGGVGATASVAATSGSSSIFNSLAPVGGGSGGSGAGAGPTAARSGGSGGGGGNGASPAGGAGTAGQGYAGGAGNTTGPVYPGGGGGGSAAAGAAATSLLAGAGGAGISSSISGTATNYAAGGGGAINNASGTVGAGGLGGGGTGAAPGGSGGNGTANTGSGGGGNSTGGTLGSGASGVLILRYPGVQKGTGGVVTSSGGYTIHTFTTSDTFTA
ncbi:glycine-rich domain-containing protein [Humidesulfovibrio idahonensis]